MCIKIIGPPQTAKLIAEFRRREGIAPNLFYSWSKEFLEAGKRRMMGDTKRQTTTGEVRSLRLENSRIKELMVF